MHTSLSSRTFCMQVSGWSRGPDGIFLAVRGTDLDHPGAGRAWLLIVPVPVFASRVRFPSAGGVHGDPGVPGRAPAPTAPDLPPSVSLGWLMLVRRVPGAC